MLLSSLFRLFTVQFKSSLQYEEFKFKLKKVDSRTKDMNILLTQINLQ